MTQYFLSTLYTKREPNIVIFAKSLANGGWGACLYVGYGAQRKIRSVYNNEIFSQLLHVIVNESLCFMCQSCAMTHNHCLITFHNLLVSLLILRLAYRQSRHLSL